MLKIPLSCGLLLLSAHSPLLWAETTAQAAPERNALGELIETTVEDWGERVPQLLPAQSDRATVPPQTETEDATKLDQHHGKWRRRIDTWAHGIDDWFGEPDPDRPASANVRLMLDQTWSEHEGYHVKPRIRGRIKLPTLERRFSVVFGDDSLDDQLATSSQLQDNHSAVNSDKRYDARNTRESNQSLALRWSKGMKNIGVDTDLDLGVRSGDDVYVRAKASKDWRIAEHVTTRAEQIYRYGIDSKHYVRSNFEIKHQRDGQPFIANQVDLTYADDDQDAGISWGNTVLREHQFFKGNRMSYGISASGSSKKSHFNSYGPFVSWRQPFLRDWFFVQADVNYKNNRDEDRDHEIGTFVRLEAIF
ncbi:hypothetical protein LVJ82_18215 [Vitreoscilla massiliensis]|uniref:Porin n=1 Tax=Vitreoscilla massiliensis TaxID=1689272 RepID=A0ABY4E0M0_9NEIS|nr:hypothetical protein [Vitreoscilla massiliensis]UOO89351.1 hypothetical protein LVJ82_18215 [Vitreoscilla massiliensis]